MEEQKVYEGHLNADGKRFAVVASRYNEIITDRLINGAEDCLRRHGANQADIEIFRVPGAFEVPLVASRAAKSGRFDAVICVGTVIRGQTPHFDFVAAEAARGIGRVSNENDLPVIFGIVTTDTVEQAVDRAGGRTGNRGAEAALAAIEMTTLLEQTGIQE